MDMRVKLRLTGRQHAALLTHLFPGDGNESVAVALCGAAENHQDDVRQMVFSVRRLELIPTVSCRSRTPVNVTWSTDHLLPLLQEASARHFRILKIHSHPTGVAGFSLADDKADRDLFTGLAGWLDTDLPGVSAIMLPGGHIIARAVDAEGDFTPVASVAVAGSDIQVWHGELTEGLTYTVPEFALRNAQTFGQRTTELLSRLKVGVVGVSGTGSPVVEMLHRLGVGDLVLVDPKRVEGKNLNRIYNATRADVAEKRYKVDVQDAAIKAHSLGTRVLPVANDLFHTDVVRRLAQCDVIFGCMDAVDGRNLLNRLCTCYSIPYFDLGVRLDADGKGGVEQVAGTVHYLQPDGSSLLSRGVYTPEDLRAADLRRTDPAAYAEQVAEKYIRGGKEDSPAVISVNTLVAAHAVNDFLARIHPFRDDPNSDIAAIRFSLTQSRMLTEPEGAGCPLAAKYVGLGDLNPLLDMPILSE